MTGELLLPIKSQCTLVIVEHDLDFIKNIGPNPFPARLQSGRILYYDAIPSTIANPAAKSKRAIPPQLMCTSFRQAS